MFPICLYGIMTVPDFHLSYEFLAILSVFACYFQVIPICFVVDFYVLLMLYPCSYHVPSLFIVPCSTHLLFLQISANPVSFVLTLCYSELIGMSFLCCPIVV